MVERYDIRGMGQGVPLATGDNHACGTVGPHMFEAGLCSTRQIAQSWGLIAKGVEQRVTSHCPVNLKEARMKLDPVSSATPTPTGVGTVIEDALRAAGLMR